MRTPVYSTKFKKDYKRCIKRGFSMQKIIDVMESLENEIPLPPQFKEHPLQGEYVNCLECHVEPDWLLIYGYEMLDDDESQLLLVRTGSHSDLFEVNAPHSPSIME